MENPENHPQILTEVQLMKIVRNDPSVERLFSLDSGTDIIINRLDSVAINQMLQEFPGFLTPNSDYIYSINVVSSRMLDNKGYKKIRFYLSPMGEILKKLES
jgi:hypothetical protein